MLRHSDSLVLDVANDVIMCDDANDANNRGYRTPVRVA